MDRPDADARRAVARRADTCHRCGGIRYLIADDGPVVCRGCLYAWGSFGRFAAPTTAAVGEPGRAELDHRARHRGLASLGCIFCTTGR